MADLNDDEILRLYLDESLDAEGMARIEKRLRQEPGLLERLDQIRTEQIDPAVHSVGMAWISGRLTCPARSEWTQHFSGVLEQPRSAYLQFHLEVVQCPFCQANATDLRQRESRRKDSSPSIADRSAQAAGWLKSD